MRYLMQAAIVVLAIAGCSNPKDIVLGPEPLKQMAEQGEQFKKLPEEDRKRSINRATPSADEWV